MRKQVILFPSVKNSLLAAFITAPAVGGYRKPDSHSSVGADGGRTS